MVEVVEVGGVGIDTGGRERFTGRAEQFVHRGLFLALALEDDLLRVGDDDVETRAIQRVERRARFFEIVEAQVRGQKVDVLRRHHAREVEGFDLLQ
ncbi:hypothetical protein D9M68_850800 [compost metagenome]